MPEKTPAPRTVTPTRIIPPGTAMPLPDRGPDADEVPPWRAPAPREDTPPPPPQPPDPPAPPPLAAPEPTPAPAPEIHLHVTLGEPDVGPGDTGPRWSFAWLRPWLRPYQSLIAAALAVLPLFNGRSLATGWAATLYDVRTEASIAAAYVIAGLALALGLLADIRTRRWWARTLLITTAIGGTGALHWFDPITAITGVHR